MKLRRLAMTGIAGLSLLAAACGQKAPEAPAQPAAVTAPATAPAAAPTPAPTPTPAAAAEPAGHAAADPHAGCAEHAAKPAEGAAAAADCAAHGEKGEAGCAHGEAAAAASPTPAEKLHLGDAFTMTAEKPLRDVLAAATDGESTVRVSGTIEKVCQKKGCWMVVRDGDMEARVIMKDYGFVVPIDSAGRKTSVEGVLKVKVFTEAQAKHLAEDGGEDPKAVAGERKEFLLTATAIDIGG